MLSLPWPLDLVLVLAFYLLSFLLPNIFFMFSEYSPFIELLFYILHILLFY